ncbi:MAG: hypothetical protein KDA84_12395, partial [Planctomycetaceae bacterium]|nr:hypothetical protein [Planctomycetaceae bacterium]
AVKMIHGLDTLSGQGFVFDGNWHQSYLVNYTKLEDCPAHDAYDPITELSNKVTETTAGDFLARVQSDLGPSAVIEFNQELLESLTCPRCQETTQMLASLGKVTESAAKCPKCENIRTPNLYHSLGTDSSLLDKTLEELGVPLWDIIGGRAGMEQHYYEFAGDRPQVLGALAEGQKS